MEALKERFLANMDRHPEASWEDAAEKLADPAKAAAVAWMEETGGEPDVVALGGRLGDRRLLKGSASRPVQTPTTRSGECAPSCLCRAMAAYFLPNKQQLKEGTRWDQCCTTIRFLT
jgi:hypothetical protein